MFRSTFWVALLPFVCSACLGVEETESSTPANTTVTLLFANDIESAYDPIPAFWLDDQQTIGDIAEMTTPWWKR